PDDAGDLLPVEVAVEANPQPATVPDVGRSKEPFRVGLDHRLLGADRRRTPEGQLPVAVVVVPDLGELPPADEPGRRLVAQALLGSRQGQADLPEAAEDRLVQSPAAAEAGSLTVAGMCRLNQPAIRFSRSIRRSGRPERERS